MVAAVVPGGQDGAAPLRWPCLVANLPGRGEAMSERGSNRGKRDRRGRSAACMGMALCFLALLSGPARADVRVFTYTGAQQTFTVPAGVTSLHVVAVGGEGGSASGGGGFGARV